MTTRLNRSNLQVSETLVNCIENDALPKPNVMSERVWNKFALILNHFAHVNTNIRETRSKMINAMN